MKEWLRETHGPGFELLRHFLSRFLDTDFVTVPGQVSKMLIAGIPVFLQWFFLLIYPLHQKYAYISGLGVTGVCRDAIQADELWLITLMMAAIGLITALKWQSLFPDLRDYRVLGALPLRSRQIFTAKLGALALVATAALVTLNFLPSVLFPMLSAKCGMGLSVGTRIWAHTPASLAGCAFFCFGLVALQGVLLNLLPWNAFARVSRNLQGLLVASMLVLLVASFSIQPQLAKMLLQPAWSRWLPPVWFLALYQSLTGDHNSQTSALAHRAVIAVVIALALTVLTYLLSYRRRRTFPVEGPAKLPRHGFIRSRLINWFVRDPRQQAVLSFMLKTLTRSSYHRMLMMSYGGLATAVLLMGFLGMPRVVRHDTVVAADFVFYHLTTLLVLLIAARHVFSRPVELGANWIFQITEREGRRAWLIAVDRFVLFWGALILVIPFPLEVRLLGWRGVAEAALFTVIGLLAYDWTFSSWEKLPFTCSWLPGKTPAWVIVACFGLIGVASAAHAFFLAILYVPGLFVVVFSLLLISWIRIHRGRRSEQAEMPLNYVDLPEPAVRELKLLR